MRGWIKLHRKMLESPVWQNSTPAHKAVVITILMQANHDQQKWYDQDKACEMVLKPGQFTTSIRKLAGQAEVSVGAARNALERLCAQDFIQVDAHNRFTLITVCNWSYYQSQTANNTTHNTEHEREANERSTREAHKQEVKNVKNERKQQCEIPPDIEQLVFNYEDWPDNHKTYDVVAEFCDTYDNEWVLQALKDAQDAGANGPSWARKRLQDWYKKGGPPKSDKPRKKTHMTKPLGKMPSKEECCTDF